MSKDDEGCLSAADEAVVDVLMRTDRILERYRQKKKDAGEEVDFEQPSFTDRLLSAQIINQTTMANAMGVGGAEGMTPDTVFKKLDELRLRLFEEVKAHVEEIMTRPVRQVTQDPTDILAAAASAGVTMPVKMVPAQVHERFEAVLFKKDVSMSDAKLTLELLLNTHEGNDMLKLMLYDAVGIMRKRAASPKGG